MRIHRPVNSIRIMRDEIGRPEFRGCHNYKLKLRQGELVLVLVLVGISIRIYFYLKRA